MNINQKRFSKLKIDHIAIAVNDVEEAAKKYQEVFGIDKVEFETIET